MKSIQKRLSSLFMAAVMLLSMAVTPAMAAEKKEPPTTVKGCTTASSSRKYSMVTMEFEDSTWVNAISAVEIDGENYSKSGFSNPSSGKKYFAGKYSDPYGSGYIYILQVNLPKDTESAKCVISANDYEDLTINLKKSGNQYTATIAQDSPGGSGGESEKPGTPENSTADLSKVSFAASFDGNDWQVSFGEADYADKISGVSVNGTAWETASLLTRGGQYKIDDGKLLFARNSYGAVPALKSGDLITITAAGYEDLTFKLVIDKNGNASVSSDTESGDPYKLHVKIEGSFEAAIVGQKDYDGVSSASVGGASSNKNSAVTVYGALVEKDAEPTAADWEKLDHQSKISLEGSKCKVNIVPDTASGTKADADSGMKGVYMTLSSDLTLNGVPKDAGSYLVSVHIEDDQGRTANSNALPFRIYTGEETLADQIKTENLKQYQSGLYAWDIMEPWAIKNFGSNVDSAENSVRVPEKLEVWYGSHESGTYGVLGYDIAWDDVEADKIPQTLYIPDGCDLTLLNMKILSSVRIVLENGGKLTLRDSTVQGIIDVQSGGVFSMNYNAYNKKFETGASLCGQLRLADGSILENAAIYSHANYLANGNRTDRTTHEPVVITTGNVQLKGQVFISGDAGGSEIGQSGLRVNGTLSLDNDAVLAVYGGKGTVVDTKGGTAIELNNGTITGGGKVIALGGEVLWKDGGTAVSGIGTIATGEAYLQGATAYTHSPSKAQPGKAHDDTVTVTANRRHVAGGELIDAVDDPLAGLYWKTGIDAAPDLSKYTITPIPGYVLMNIPYNAFYAAEKGDSDTAAQVDAVSSATKSKPLSSLAANSYHNNSDGSDISGITYPVYVPDLSALRGCKQVKDSDILTITVTLRGQVQTTTYTGKDTLFGAPDYSYYVLSAEPSSYKALTVSNGTLSFGKATATATAASGASAALTTNGRHAYYVIKVAGLAEDIASKVSAVTLHTTDNHVYGLRHVAEIWRGTELGFGVDSGLQGKTIDAITYYLNDGTIQSIKTNLKIPKSTKNVTATVENALNTAREAMVTVENLPEDFNAQYAVASGNTDLSAYNFKVEGAKLTWTDTPAFGAYTLTITDKGGVYAPVSASFELKTADVIAKYDASKKALVKASSDIMDEQLAAYLKSISAVSVDGKSYAASGRSAVTVIKDGGMIDLTAAPFSKGDGAVYSMIVKATGYQDLTFTLEVPRQSNHSSGSSGSSSGGFFSSSGWTYAVSAPSSKNGDVTVSLKNASKGDRVTITATPDKGYELDKLTVKDASGNNLKLTDMGNGKYTFIMPASKVTVEGSFKAAGAAVNPFVDVLPSDYCYDTVLWAVNQGVTSGVSSTMFAPNQPCTRAQIVTFLWRAAGSPAPKSASNFTDVPADAYYAKAVAWAVENGITGGTGDGKFSPDATCTRAQAVTFLYRASGSPAVSGSAAFTDVAADAYYAAAVAWAEKNGITGGIGGGLFGSNQSCTRGQIVTFLYRTYNK